MLSAPSFLRKAQGSACNKILLCVAAFTLAVAVVSVVASGSAVVFPLISLWCSTALFTAVLLVLRVANVRLGRFHCAVLFAVWLAAILYFYWALHRRAFIYYWDYSNYINKQYTAEAAFAQGTVAGLRNIFGSFADDYTNFITLFLEFPFCLTDHTGDSFAFCQVFSILPAILAALGGLTIKVGQILHIKQHRRFFVIGLSLTVTYPFLRMSAMLAQPDWFGLIFAFSILTLTLDYRFAHPEPVRYILLFLSTAAVILSRRWYLYFVVGYYFAYAALVFVSSARTARAGGQKQALRQVINLILFGLLSMAAMVALLWPMVSHILSYNYAERYSYYNGGGFAAEIYLQFWRTGLLNFILVGLGLWLCLKQKKLFALPCLAGFELLLSMLLFTRVQNTGSHQMLLFLPGWFVLFLCGAAALSEQLDKHRKIKLGYVAFTLVFAVSVRCSPLTNVALPDFVIDHFPLKAAAEFVRLDKLIYDRQDASSICALSDWIDAHCSDDEFAYMIPHDLLYNADDFINCRLPERELQDKLIGGFSVPGTHNFPMQFFEAKYVLTADPFPQTFVGNGELSGRFNDLFTAVREQYFDAVATFDMGNGTTFTVWQRTKEVTRAEVEYYLEAFAAEDEQYPEMFSQIAEKWLAERGL